MICDTLETRQLITLGADGILVRGTYHNVPRKTTGSTNLDKRIGVLFLNPLPTPRSFLGDAAVYWASSFAAQGYPSLRIDLPGFGDSYGEVPFLTFINNAGFAAIAAAKVEEFSERFGLAGVVIYGHCAGGTTAIYAASACKACKGLIITDPYFNTANMLTPKLSPGMVHWARRTKVGEVLRAAYARLREARKKQDNATLPGNANVKLVTHWKQLVSSGLPILVCKSPEPAADLGSSKLRASMFDYLEHITSFAGHRSRLSLHTIEGTNHSFADRVGRAAIREHAEAWLHEHFAGEAAETACFPETVASTPLLKRQDAQVQAAPRLGTSFITRVSPGD
jgi:pimeloyl-ACP methyl ester carboxylesterase